MFELAAITYGVLASFVMASLTRNKRAARRNPPILALFAWGLAGFSLGSAIMLIGYVGIHALSGGAA
ncbi:hypothetical protein [Sphingomonas sp. MMS24-J13]|uniref:hypothetical protein n=1 Tax=Sphingomonas sp. MMS24-J13 TaxID=3238686 RepID=UPI00384C01B0